MKEVKDKPLNFIVIGRSGCGKGTQAEFLKKKFGNLYHFSTGDLFRDLGKQDTDVAMRVQETLEKGGLPFDFIAITLWMHKIAYNLKKEEGLLADGFPRRLNEAKVLDELLEFLERKDNTKIIYIDVSEEEIFERLLKRGRYDDNKKAIRGRLDYFKERVVSVLDYYRKKNRLIEVDGNPHDTELIHKNIIKALGL